MVDPRPPSACTGIRPLLEGETCLATCDCESGLECVPVEGDVLCYAMCARPCERSADGRELGLDCPTDRECTTAPLEGASIGTACRPRTTDACSDASPCPDGMRCMSDDGDATSYCAWDVVLSGTSRHECNTDADCEMPGLDCVDHGPLGFRMCDLRCTTTTMRCPGPHVCDARGVCEWIGE